MITRRLFAWGALMTAGLPPRRLDQHYNPPAPPGPVGGAAGVIAKLRIANSVINAKGMFFYSGPPAAGNLVASVGVLVNGPDGFGNTALAGDTSYVARPPGFQAIQNFGGAINLYTATTEAGPWTATGAIQLTNALGTQLQLDSISGPLNLLAPASAVLVGVRGTPLTSAGGLEVVGGIAAGRLDVAPAATAPPARPAGTEPWNAMALLNSWANAGGTLPPARYRLIASPPNSVEIDGVITHAAIAGASQIFTLPAAYQPANGHNVVLDFLAATGGWANAANWPPRIVVATNGNLTATDLPAGTTEISFHGIFPLD